jgi:hypothetical protein
MGMKIEWRILPSTSRHQTGGARRALDNRLG